MSDIVMTAINAANTRLNGRVETLQPIGGQIVGNTQAFSQQVVNDAWRKLQNRLADMRYSGLQQETVMTGVPPTAVADPVAQVSFTYAGYYDGAANWPAFALPGTLIQPYELTERPSGSGALFTEMDKIPWSLPRVPKANWNRQWLWRNNTLFLPGALVLTDITLLFAGLFSDFLDTAGATWFQQTIPILNAVDAFADYICREISIARQDMDGAVAFQESGDRGALLIANQDTAQGKSVAKNAELGKMQDRFTPKLGGDTDTVKRG